MISDVMKNLQFYRSNCIVSFPKYKTKFIG